MIMRCWARIIDFRRVRGRSLGDVAFSRHILDSFARRWKLPAYHNLSPKRRRQYRQSHRRWNYFISSACNRTCLTPGLSSRLKGRQRNHFVHSEFQYSGNRAWEALQRHISYQVFAQCHFHWNLIGYQRRSTTIHNGSLSPMMSSTEPATYSRDGGRYARGGDAASRLIFYMNAN